MTIASLSAVSGPRVGAAHSLSLPAISDMAIRGLVAEMDREGFAVLPDYLTERDLAALQGYARAAVAAVGGEYVALTGKEAMSGSLLAGMSDHPAFVSLMHRVYAEASGQSPPDQSLFQVLRCLKGRSGLAHAFRFHYDSYVVTALLPLAVPSARQSGDLVMLRRRRKLRARYVTNLIDKLALDNAVTQRALRLGYRAGLVRLRQVKVVPGNLYLFRGYQTVHANLVADPDQLRATALFHFADPHAGSRLRRLTGRATVRAVPSG